jgi:diguanylate cyclase (GGDEF)-like protein
MLVGVAAGSSLMVRTYKADTTEMQQRAQVASLLQEAEANASMSGLLVLRYTLAGGDNYPAEIVGLSDLVTVNLQEARTLAVELGDDTRVAELDKLLADQAILNSTAKEIVALRQDGKVEEALAAQENNVAVFRELRLGLIAANGEELQSVADLRSQADEMGNLALWLLIVSGVAGTLLGLAVSILIARSILKPLSSLESTALKVARGEMEARAHTGGPRELAHLGKTMNYMMDTIQERTQEVEERTRQVLDARAQAATDPLTNLGNHRKFHERIREVLAIAQAEAKPVGMIMIDVDNFKAVNDALGHQAGDQVMRDVSTAIQGIVHLDCAYRYGGDEFAVLLPGSAADDTAKTAHDLRTAIERKLKRREAGKITVSVGAASFPDMAASADELIYRADMAMNWSKSAGKNRVAIWKEVLGNQANP